MPPTDKYQMTGSALRIAISMKHPESPTVPTYLRRASRARQNQIALSAGMAITVAAITVSSMPWPRPLVMVPSQPTSRIPAIPAHSAEYKAECTVQRAYAAVEHEVGDPHGDVADNDQRDHEDADDRSTQGHILIADVLFCIGQHTLVKQEGRYRCGDP